MAAQPPQPAPCRTCGRASPDDVLVCPHDGSQLPLERRLLDGKFRLERRLGHGGMASVWQATNEFIERPVAIKLMHARYAEDADLLARFRNEATAAGRIGSPHICDVLDFGRSPIGPYIVMELLSGCSLSDLIHAYTKIDPGLAVWIVRQALDGLDAAHRAGIVHRDLKPENIYLCRAIRDQWLVKLMDFGISKFNDSLRTGAGTTMGSPNYMAPEQIRGAEAVDARADLWSIGAILYEAVTGASPFARDTIADSLAAVRSFDPPLLHTRVPEVPPGLSEIIARCLRKAPDQRWPSAQALGDALRPFERPGTRMREPPPEPRDAVPAGTTTMRRSGAAPRALVDAARDPQPAPSARSKSADKPPSGPYPPVLNARPGPADRPPSLAQPGPSARAGTIDRAPSGAHAAVPSARPGTVDRPPSLAGSGAPAAARSGTFERSPGAAGPSGAHAAVPGARPATSGAHAAVPRAATGAQPSVSPARSSETPASPARSAADPSGAHAPLPRAAPLQGGFKPVPRSLALKQAAAAPAPAPAASSAPRPNLRRADLPSHRPSLRPLIVGGGLALLAALTGLFLYLLR